MITIRILSICWLIFASLASFVLRGENLPKDQATERPAASPDLTASLITCYPGPEVYELCGHEALRIRGRDSNGELVDSVWNYGVFDFNSPNFLYRFVKGETDYMVIGYPFVWFLPEYRDRGSKVVEQDLNLTQEEVSRLRTMLQINSLPQNRIYRYNYVRDNCSTRIAAITDSASTAEIYWPHESAFPTFREAMRHYHKNYPWYQFGIDLALGSQIDTPINGKESIFVPMQLQGNATKARFSDGRTLITETRILTDSSNSPDSEADNIETGGTILPATPKLLTPMAVMIYLLIISALTAIWGWGKGILVRWWYTIFFGLIGLTGCIIWFLVFISSHYATSPNILYLWLSPLQLMIPIFIWCRKTLPVVTAMIWVNVIIIVLMILIWPWQPQCTNPAVFLWMTSGLMLCAGYLLTIAKGDRSKQIHKIYKIPSNKKSPIRKRAKR